MYFIYPVKNHLRQIKLRADRIGKCSGTLKLLCETSLDSIEDILTKK